MAADGAAGIPVSDVRRETNMLQTVYASAFSGGRKRDFHMPEILGHFWVTPRKETQNDTSRFVLKSGKKPLFIACFWKI